MARGRVSHGARVVVFIWCGRWEAAAKEGAQGRARNAGDRCTVCVCRLCIVCVLAAVGLLARPHSGLHPPPPTAGCTSAMF